MKAMAQQKKLEQGEEQDVEMQVYEVPEEVNNALLLDRVYQELQRSCIILDDFTQFPIIRLHNGQLFFMTKQQASGNCSINDVIDPRIDYFALRLAFAEERVFSHSDKYQRAKLSAGPTTVKYGQN